MFLLKEYYDEIILTDSIPCIWRMIIVRVEFFQFVPR